MSHDDAILRMCRTENRQNLMQHVQGLVTARVVRIEENGMYRLNFFGMNGQDGDSASTEARCMMPMAGGGRGVHFLPEPGDEVVVGFQTGETATPIILGALWNGTDTPPSQARQSPRNDVRTIVTRSGHELTFDDTPNAEKVTLRTQHGHVVELDDAPMAPKVTVRSAGGQFVEMADAPPRSMTLQGPTGTRIVLQEGGVISLSATTAINLNAPALTLGGTAVTISSAAGATTIDGIPFKPHVHANTAPLSGSVSGPVAAI